MIFYFDYSRLVYPLPLCKGNLISLKLNDDWDYTPDDTIAEGIFSDIDSSAILPQQSELSRLCSRCSSLRLWDMDCTFYDSPEGLDEKSEKETCALCALLSQNMLAQSKSWGDFVRFARVSSYVTIDDSRCQAIANIYTVPGNFQTR